MLFLAFQSGGNLYAVDARQVVEVVPRVPLRPVAHAPEYLAGLLWYRGSVVPTVDFSRLLGGVASREVLSTRIIITALPARGGSNGTEAPRLGILAEQVDQVLRSQSDDVVLPAMDLPDAPYLGRIFELPEGLVQLIKPERLLSDRLFSAIFPVEAETP